MADVERVISFEVDGKPVSVPDSGATLLGVLRYKLGFQGPKAGCSPQGQCGCCTVLVDGQARVACVTPVKRVRNRSVTTVDGLDPDRAKQWGDAFCSTGGSQCGFCTPGIVMRLESLKNKGIAADDHDAVRQALLAHLCRCTGWQTVVEAWDAFGSERLTGRDLEAASQRAELEGGAPQVVSPEVALGRGAFSSDTVPAGALVAARDDAGVWHVAENLPGAKNAAGKTQGRRTTIEHSWPLEIPPGDWDLTLRTTWVEPAILETDASWCEPGGEPSPLIGNGGAFGAKQDSPVRQAAQDLANEHDRTVLAFGTREDTVLWGPKRPPVACGIKADGTGVIRVVACPGIEQAIKSVAPDLVVELVEVTKPETSSAIRAAGWAEATILLAGVASLANGDGSGGPPGQGDVSATSQSITAPNGATAEVVLEDGVIKVHVRCGRPLDEIVLRSYCIGAAHMAWSWLTSEALTVDADGVAQDLTIRSFGVLRAIDTPPIEVDIDIEDDREPMNGSDAVFVAVAAAGWKAASFHQDWPIGKLIPGQLFQAGISVATSD